MFLIFPNYIVGLSCPILMLWTLLYTLIKMWVIICHFKYIYIHIYTLYVVDTPQQDNFLS